MAACRRTAFTLIELLFVIVVIGILVALVATAGFHVIQGSKSGVTQNTIRVLDQILVEYTSTAGGAPAKTFRDEKGRTFPILDARLSTGTDYTAAAEPSLAVFFLAARKTGVGDDALKSLDAKSIERLTSVSTAFGIPNDAANKPIPSLTVKDAWGRPIRMVIPAYQGGYGDFFDQTQNTRTTLSITAGNAQSLTFRRSVRPYDPKNAQSTWVGDADEGICSGNNAYFYSAGPDGNPGTRSDNAYTSRPTWPTETEKME
ncbi:MAG: type II secretion system protein [Phycisphaerae bacterium]|nr:type II secretion system protein [Phycisphaerae bacterium]